MQDSAQFFFIEGTIIRRFSLGRVMAKLPHTSETAIAILKGRRN